MKHSQFIQEYQDNIEKLVEINEQMDLEIKTAQFYEDEADKIIAIPTDQLSISQKRELIKKTTALLNKVMLEHKLGKTNFKKLHEQMEKTTRRIAELNVLKDSGQLET